jgi:hypothetical protein
LATHLQETGLPAVEKIDRKHELKNIQIKRDTCFLSFFLITRIKPKTMIKRSINPKTSARC